MLRAVVVMSVLAGCDVGEVPIGGTPGIDAPGMVTEDPANKTSFDATITPLAMANNCMQGGACHVVQQPILNDYSKLLAKYKMKPAATNVLITKGDGAAVPHSGLPYWDAAEKAMVTAWIDGLK